MLAGKVLNNLFMVKCSPNQQISLISIRHCSSSFSHPLPSISHQALLSLLTKSLAQLFCPIATTRVCDFSCHTWVAATDTLVQSILHEARGIFQKPIILGHPLVSFSSWLQEDSTRSSPVCSQLFLYHLLSPYFSTPQIYKASFCLTLGFCCSLCLECHSCMSSCGPAARLLGLSLCASSSRSPLSPLALFFFHL